MAHLSGGVLALLDTLTFPETMTILVVALIVLGPDKLPGMARSIGEWMSKLKKMSANLQAEVREVMDDPQMQPLRELGEFAAQPRKKLAEYAMAAEAEVERADAAAEPDAAGDAESGADGDAADNGTEEPRPLAPHVDLADARTDEEIEAEIAATEAQMAEAGAAARAEIAAAEDRGDVELVQRDAEPVKNVEPVKNAEPVKKVVATGPNHPMERQSPEPQKLES